MRQCSRCDGFVPDSTGACPNCGARRKRRRASKRLSLLGAAGVFITGCTCYGGPAVPCRMALKDGGIGPCDFTCNTVLLDGGVVADGRCITCAATIADGGLVANDPLFRVACQTPLPDAGDDGGTDAGDDGGADAGDGGP